MPVVYILDNFIEGIGHRPTEASEATRPLQNRIRIE
jgi:hypothetical protein